MDSCFNFLLLEIIYVPHIMQTNEVTYDLYEKGFLMLITDAEQVKFSKEDWIAF